MNRLILIGNGFDLAHGLKTGYNDFIKWYLKKCIKLSHKKKYSGSLIDVLYNQFDGNEAIDRNVESLIDFWSSSSPGLVNCTEYYITTGTHSRKPNPYKIELKSSLIKQLFTKCSNNSWVDIENEYYEMLKSISSPKNNNNKKAEIIELNNSLRSLIVELEGYLSLDPNAELNDSYIDIFTTPFIPNDFIDYSKLSSGIPNNILLLSFNYTDTVNQYLEEIERYETSNVSVNYIHGRLNDSSNPVIFGFGDELDEHYDLMEKEKVKEYFEYIKSFWYFKTDNYRNLLRFIEADEFQVFVVGHSCGLSDRTMLSMIFEHYNCKSIKIYYYENDEGYNNHNDLTIEIARHFNNKAKMRELIVSKVESKPMPQHK